MRLSAGAVVAERFQLVRQLGEGGMGEVWLAHHTKLETPCAVKFIHADVVREPGVVDRFEREAKVAAQLRSPHVVQVLDYGVSEGVPYIAMEYLEGEDLGARLKARGRLSPVETVGIVAQMSRALTKAHGSGLVHRDLKPENVFLIREDDGELVKILDFGIAKAPTPLLDGNTRTGAMLGTPRFMSPEQAQGLKGIDHRSDLWSVAVITYRAIVGHFPFDSDALGDLLMRIMVHPLPVPSSILPGLPTSFDAWWARAAARDPAQRFQTARELAEALALSLGTSPQSVAGGPVPWVPAGPTPPAVAAHSPVPPTDSRFGGSGAPVQALGLTTPVPGTTPAPPMGVAIAPAGGVQPAPTMLGAMPPHVHQVQHVTGGAVPAHTMSPASRTYGTGQPPKRSSAPVVAVGGVVALVAVAAVAVFALRQPSGADAAATSATDAPSATVIPAVAASASSAPGAATSVEAEPSAEPTASAKATAPPPKAAPRPQPTAPPAPTRTGKVKLAPPSP